MSKFEDYAGFAGLDLTMYSVSDNEPQYQCHETDAAFDAFEYQQKKINELKLKLEELESANRYLVMFQKEYDGIADIVKSHRSPLETPCEFIKTLFVRFELSKKDVSKFGNPIGFQFEFNGRWHLGDLDGKHLESSEAAGYKCRDLYAVNRVKNWSK